ncbi:MAG: DUF5320 domain-containing protein [Candidatus Lokiarchaeota archaeon]|nr:DUF5320 domain-containing protein [Candidatus Lokiarchaeota archaeon]
MPYGDRTGPRGLGPRTGRALGYCAGYDTPGYTQGPGMGLGRGWGRGFGRGRGMGWGGRFSWGPPVYPLYGSPITVPAPIAPLSKEDRLSMLKQEKEYLDSEMNQIKKAIEDLSKNMEDLEKTQ